MQKTFDQTPRVNYEKLIQLLCYINLNFVYLQFHPRCKILRTTLKVVRHKNDVRGIEPKAHEELMFEELKLFQKTSLILKLHIQVQLDELMNIFE